MENRKEYRAEKQNNKGWGYESGNEAKVDTVETPHDANAEEYRDSEIKVVDVKQDDLPDPLLDDCGVSPDSAFEEYIKPRTIKSVKQSHNHEPGRLCDKCFKDSKGDWDCRDSYCDNCIPF